ncbi:hypothetical protein [Butyrivibrio sp.]|uniref:hypothetical protein n=1 Tax=Butyrivibrio sp. TaxID=28121 RepID=UPI0025BB2973|nr:hypothetical protein [Butyrivibrio sp.]MBQ7431157.1 hypothetical protein [Butyrivibrio sp.]MBQ9302523.1 hypothetical protein [Butyrivibrio sp.]
MSECERKQNNIHPTESLHEYAQGGIQEIKEQFEHLAEPPKDTKHLLRDNWLLIVIMLALPVVMGCIARYAMTLVEG